jgi:hypothetical protein
LQFPEPLFDAESEDHLFSTNRTCTKGKNLLNLNLGEHVEKGVRKFKVVISNNSFQQEDFIELR